MKIILTFILYYLSLIHVYFCNKKKRNYILENYSILNDYINPKKSYILRKHKNPTKKKIKREKYLNYNIITQNKDIFKWYLKDYKILNNHEIKTNIYKILYCEIEYSLRKYYNEKNNYKNNYIQTRWVKMLEENKKKYNNNLNFKTNVKNLIIDYVLNYEYSYIEKKRYFYKI